MMAAQHHRHRPMARLSDWMRHFAYHSILPLAAIPHIAWVDSILHIACLPSILHKACASTPRIPSVLPST